LFAQKKRTKEKGTPTLSLDEPMLKKHQRVMFFAQHKDLWVINE